MIARVALAAAMSVLLVACPKNEPSTTASSATATAPTTSTTATATTTATPTPTPTPTPTATTTYAFDRDAVGAPPSGFTFGKTGGGRAGKWIVQEDKSAPSAPNVLAQLDADETDMRFPMAIAPAPDARDVRVSVRCKAVSGKVDRACGIVFRWVDENDYYLTRANALEDNVRLYTVKGGVRRQIADYKGKITSDAWHAYRVDVTGDHIEVYWDDKKVIDHRDTTFTAPGKCGVWTKADSVTYFDDLVVTPLP